MTALTMKVHLFTTDVSGLRLLENSDVGISANCLIVPGNRHDTAKIAELEAVAQIPIVVHQRGEALPQDMPPADVAFSWLYSQIIQEADILRYPLGVLNMHGGVIPDYRGANVLQWAIINGESELGITWHELVREVDAGPIWAESRIAIPPEATAWELRTHMIEAGLGLFATAWQRFTTKNFTPRLADLATGRVWPSRKPEDGRIDPGWSEQKVRDMLRALCPPWPPATIYWEGSWSPIHGVSRRQVENGVPYVTAEGKKIFLLQVNGNQ